MVVIAPSASIACKGETEAMQDEPEDENAGAWREKW